MTVELAKIMPTDRPMPSAQMKPSVGLLVVITVAMPVIAPSAIRPSTPRLTTPTRSASTSPSAASASTPPARIEVCSSPAMISIGLSGRRFAADNAVMRKLVTNRGEEQDQARDRQHGRGIESLGLQDDSGIEDDGHQRRACHHPERRA